MKPFGIAPARDKFKAFIPNGDMAAFAKALPQKLEQDFTAAMNLLRDSAFQDLLVNYERKADSFLVAYGIQDTVTTEWNLHDPSGKCIKPEDYLASFARFVQENPERIEAIRILLDRPRDWSVQALAELKAKLEQSRKQFKLELLQRAHAIRYRRDLVDIISMVKHAARDQEPLLTAEEWVDRAFQQITAGREFTDQQRLWLDRIRDHLIVNLSIGREDFDDLPVFVRYGGWATANRDFEGKLADLVTAMNEAVAA